MNKKTLLNVFDVAGLALLFSFAGLLFLHGFLTTIGCVLLILAWIGVINFSLWLSVFFIPSMIVLCVQAGIYLSMLVSK